MSPKLKSNLFPRMIDGTNAFGRVRYQVVSATPYSFPEESAKLADVIALYNT